MDYANTWTAPETPLLHGNVHPGVVAEALLLPGATSTSMGGGTAGLGVGGTASGRGSKGGRGSRGGKTAEGRAAAGIGLGRKERSWKS